jgi:hypothetical protein
MARTKMEKDENTLTMREVMRSGCQDLLNNALAGKPAYIITQTHPDKKFKLVAEDK